MGAQIFGASGPLAPVQRDLEGYTLPGLTETDAEYIIDLPRPLAIELGKTLGFDLKPDYSGEWSAIAVRDRCTELLADKTMNTLFRVTIERLLDLSQAEIATSSQMHGGDDRFAKIRIGM